MKSFDWASFVSNIIAVVLGIFITFGIQGLIDRHGEKKDVLSALELVKEELINNKESLQEVINLIAMEKEAAEFIRDNKKDFSKCDKDSLESMNYILGSEYFFTVTDDALELLKSSSLFQKINDKSLALGIIKAYDYLNADSQAFNTHEKYKTALYGEVNTDKAKKAAMIYAGPDFLKLFYSSKEGDYFIKSVIDMSQSTFMESGLPEIESTIAAIEERLHP